MKLQNVLLAFFAVLLLGTGLSQNAQAESLQSAEQVEEILDHFGLLVEDYEVFEGEAFEATARKDRRRNSARRGGKQARKGYRKGYRQGKRDGIRKGRKGKRKAARRGYRRGYRDGSYDRGWRRPAPRYPRYPAPRYPAPRYPAPIPQVTCYAKGNNNVLYPAIGQNPTLVQEAAMNYCYRNASVCEAKGCEY